MQQSRNQSSFLAITLAICLIYAMNGGVRGNFGTLLGPIAAGSGLSYGEVSLVLAVSQLVFGLLQPVFGLLVLRTSERFVLVCGSLLMACGFLLTPFCHAMWSLTAALGLLLPAGTAALSFGLLLSIAAGRMPQEKTSVASGFLNASSGLGTTVLAPALQAVIAFGGVMGAMLFLGLPSLAFIPLAFWMCRGGTGPSGAAAPGPERKAGAGGGMIRDALRSRSYVFLLLGFFTCGFHMAILETHFFSQIVSFGFSRETAAFLFSAYGILTMVGSALAGVMCTRWSMKNLLGGIYAVRVGLAAAILLMPGLMVFLVPFVVVLGLTSDSTVSPTAGLILKRFGVARLPTLFGLAFLTHQIGCFVSAWLGGVFVETAGGYSGLWMCDAVLSAMAAAVSWMVRENQAEPAGSRRPEA